MGFPVLFTLAICLPLIIHRALTSPLARGSMDLYPLPYPDPSPCFGNCSHIHDPSIIFEDGTYWRLSTGGNIAMSSAPSLKGPWTYKGPLLHQGTKIRVAFDQDIWAPSVSKFGNIYHVHYSVSRMGSQKSQIGLATSTSLSGPWTDHGSLNLPLSSSYNLIDPFVFQDSPSDPVYFTFGSYWHGIHQFAYSSPDQLRAEFDGTVEIIKPLVTNSTADAAVVEGATIWKHEMIYYLFFSVGLCCNTPPNLAAPGDEYHVAVCRAESVTGPYVDRDGKDCKTQNGGTTILASHGNVYAPGGQGVMAVPNGTDVMYYHYVQPSVGYEADQFYFGWNYLEWTNGWPVVV